MSPWEGIPSLGPLWLTFQLAGTTTVLLLIFVTPLSWWLARTQNRFKVAVDALVSLPLVLPPTVLGFYLLLAFAPDGAIGYPLSRVTGRGLAFTFEGVVLASCVYSLPFVVQPLKNAFEAVGDKPLEAAWTLGATPRDAFFSVVLPLSVRGYVTAMVLGFAHTMGEFGVVLMVGGNIPGVTRVVSIAIYDHVETLEYDQAHLLSGILLGISFLVLILVYAINDTSRSRS